MGGSMKKAAVVVYQGFCYFEISIALETLALNKKEIVVFASSLEPIISECGLTILPNQTYKDLDINLYDSLILPGVSNATTLLYDEDLLSLIRLFDDHKLLIGAISIAPVLLVKAGIMEGRPFLAGVNKDELIEAGFTLESLLHMIDWSQHIEHPIKEGYIVSDHIITAVSFDFVRWGLAFCNQLGLVVSKESFGL